MQQSSKLPPTPTPPPTPNSCYLHTFVFQREQTHQSLIIDLRIDIGPSSVDLSSIFAQYCPLKQYKICIYDPELDKFIQLSKINAEETALIPRSLLQPQVIMIRFRKLELESEISESDSGIDSGIESSRESKERNQRAKERTIGESIELVKKWRATHLDSVKLGLKKMSLSDAAKAIGVSKKSLDDYYYQLRLGEFYCFDFANNLNEKVGILRAYVKEFKPEREEKNKNVRHPRNLKIIENFDIDLPNILKETRDELPSPMFEELRSPNSCRSFSLEEDSEPNIDTPPNPFLKDVMSSYEDKFFKNFEFLLDDPNDPFIEIDRNFKKKAFEEPSGDFFFF